MTAAAEPHAATIGALLDQARLRLAAAAVEEPRRTAEILLGAVLGCDRTHLFAHAELELSSSDCARFMQGVDQRVSGAPTEYITGVREFFGRDFSVNPGVLIPRPETELLVEAVLGLAPPDARILDVGTGSGCIATTLACELPSSQILAVDIDAAALATARINSENHSAPADFYQGDLLQCVRRESVDVVVSNPPYVATRDRPTLAREVLSEPGRALFAGEDGLDIYRRLIPAAERVLRPGGLLALELGYGSLPAVRALLAGWTEVEIRPDLAGIPRVALAWRPGFAPR